MSDKLRVTYREVNIRSYTVWFVTVNAPPSEWTEFSFGASPSLAYEKALRTLVGRLEYLGHQDALKIARIAAAAIN